MYRPCFSTGPLTMYQQHICRQMALNQTECPRATILIDIAKKIQQWQEDRDHVLLLTDYNNDILSNLVCVWAGKLGLVKAVMWLNTVDAPPTFQRGSQPIDGIFAAPQLLEWAAGGHFGSGEAILSDRAIWVDFDMLQVCPHNQEAFTCLPARHLQCKDPQVVTWYNEALWAGLTTQNIPQRLAELNDTLQQPSDISCRYRMELNAIDQAVTEAKHITKNQCQKLKCGHIQWCPRITAAINKILFRKSLLKRERGGKVGLLILRMQAKKAGLPTVPHPGKYTQQTLKEHISWAYKQFQWLKKDDTRCDTWIVQLIVAQSEAWNQPKKTLWKQLRSTEQIQKMAQNVWCILNPMGTNQPLSMAVAPDKSTGKWQEHSKKTKLVLACLVEVGQCFTQARHTPLLTPPLLDIFGKCSQTKAFEKVLNDTFHPPPTCNTFMAKFLARVSRPPTIQEVTDWSTQAYCRSWQRAQESTRLLALGIHFGDYIAGTINPDILVVNMALANIPLCTGFTYDWWKKGINVMIEKTCSNFNVEKLQIILLFIANFNTNIKWIGHAIMYQAEQAHLLAEEQFGSWKFKSTIHQCLNKQLFYDIIWNANRRHYVPTMPKVVMIGYSTNGHIVSVLVWWNKTHGQQHDHNSTWHGASH